MAKILDALQEKNIVHGDINPNNIMVKIQNGVLEEVHLVDFGSAYKFDEFLAVSDTTPEYQSPELIILKESIRSRDKSQRDQTCQRLYDRSKPWSFDMWSFGIILLEIISGFPMWLPVKAKMTQVNGGLNFGLG